MSRETRIKYQTKSLIALADEWMIFRATYSAMIRFDEVIRAHTDTHTSSWEIMKFNHNSTIASSCVQVFKLIVCSNVISSIRRNERALLGKVITRCTHFIYANANQTIREHRFIKKRINLNSVINDAIPLRKLWKRKT